MFQLNTKRKVLISLFCVFAVLLYGIFFKQRTWEGHPIPDPVPTAVLQDGSTEHTLTDWIFFHDKEYFENWVLKLPPDAKYWKPDDLKKSGRVIVNGTNLGQTKSFNQSLHFYLKLPDMDFLKSRKDLKSSKPSRLRREPYDKDKLSILLGHDHKYLGIEEIQGKKKPFGFISNYVNRYGINCGLGEEIENNFFLLRDITEEERKAYDKNRYRSLFDEYCGHSGEKNYFVYFQSSDVPVASGECTKPVALREGYNNICWFSVWLPQKRTASLRFDVSYIDQFPKIYNTVVSMINNATVIEKSTNLKWRPDS